MSGKPEDVPFHCHTIQTSKGSWGIFIDILVEAQNNDNLFLKAFLEQHIDEEHVETRRLEIMVSSANLFNPQKRTQIICQIQDWIETTEGDGSLDLVSQSP
jgi:hypothetical protein